VQISAIVFIFQTVTPEVDKNVDNDLPLHIETGLTVEDSVGIESLDNRDVQQAAELGSDHKSELHDTCTDEGDESYADAEPDDIPSAVLQPNGEFMCSSCGVMMKCSRAIKRHISTHTSLLSSAPSTTSCHKTADKTDLINKGSATQSWPKKKVSESKKLPRLDNKDTSKQWRSYVCKDCGDKFTSSALLDLHRVQMHRPHKCQKCGTILTGRRNFSQHVRMEHPGMHICKVTVLLLWN